MRPVNLIPVHDRGGSAQSRTGPAVYVVVGALLAVLVGVALMVTTSNTISERQAEVSRLEAEEAAARARAASMSAFAEFASMELTRTETVSSLARSRFDWERVLRELALVIPPDVWLTDLSGSVSPDTAVASESGSATRDQIAGPALEMVGCGAGHESVARFVAALRDIDGVTRVGLSTSELPSQEQAESGATEGEGGDSCQVREFISKFEITVAFDEVAVAADDPSASAPATPATAATSSSAAEAPSTTSAEAAEVGEANADVDQATEYIPGG
jgi:Tfp pilus assembly protein PilN